MRCPRLRACVGWWLSSDELEGAVDGGGTDFFFFLSSVGFVEVLVLASLSDDTVSLVLSLVSRLFATPVFSMLESVDFGASSFDGVAVVVCDVLLWAESVSACTRALLLPLLAA